MKTNQKRVPIELITPKGDSAGRERERRARIKEMIIEHYGGKCACCGESCVGFLTVDHIYGDGAEHRRKIFGRSSGGSIMMREWIVKNNYPDSIQLLCFNCNFGRARTEGNVCPHQKKSPDGAGDKNER